MNEKAQNISVSKKQSKIQKVLNLFGAKDKVKN